MEFEIIRELETGGNACTFLIKRGQRKQEAVLRVTWQYKESIREYIALYQKLQKVLSQWIPNLLDVKIYESPVITNKNLSLAIKKYSDCSKLQKVRHDIGVVASYFIIDYVNGGSFMYDSKLSEKEICAVAFQLLMFLYVAQVKLGFDHRDLHGGNILLRRLKDYPFYEPMIIDYDYSVFHTQRPQKEPNTYGGRWILPPELLACKDVEHLNVVGATDIWSVGIVLLSKLMREEHHVTEHCHDGQELRAMYEVMSMLGIPHPEFLRTPVNEAWRQKIQQLPDTTIAFLRKLLAYNPCERTMHGKLYKIFKDPYFDDLDPVWKRKYTDTIYHAQFQTDDAKLKTNDYQHQIEQLIQGQFIEAPRCAHCNSVADQVCRNIGVVVCNEACWQSFVQRFE